MLWLVACAEGYGHPGEISAQLMVGEGGSTGTAGAGGVGAGGAAGAGMVPPMFMGDACLRGEVEACLCEGGGMGTRACVVDMASPTGGAFAACGRCVMPELPEAGSGGASASGAGASGAGSGAAGSPAGSSGSDSSSSDAGSGGSSSSGCNPRDCDEPLFGSACCTDDDECGVRLLLSCNPR